MDYHTEKINMLYGLDESRWPNFFWMNDDQVVSNFCYYSEFEWPNDTPAERHEREKRIFMYWHEIEQRGLYHTTEPEQGTFAYPWEKPDTKIDLAPGNTRDVFKELAEAILSGGGGLFRNEQGRRRKVGYNNTPDEENLGLYRREVKE